MKWYILLLCCSCCCMCCCQSAHHWKPKMRRKANEKTVHCLSKQQRTKPAIENCVVRRTHTHTHKWLYLLLTIHYNELYWTFIINSHRTALLLPYISLVFTLLWQTILYIHLSIYLCCRVFLMSTFSDHCCIKCDNLRIIIKAKKTRMNNKKAIKMKERDAQNSMGWFCLRNDYRNVLLLESKWQSALQCDAGVVLCMSVYCTVYGQYWRQYWTQHFIVCFNVLLVLF